MTIRLVDARWGKERVDALRADPTDFKFICPFIKAGTLHRLLSFHPEAIQVITRFNLADFAEGVSDIAALRKLLDADVRVRGCEIFTLSTDRTSRPAAPWEGAYERD